MQQRQPIAEPAPRPGPRLVSPRQRPHSPLAFWHLLSLDAPTVAALWAYFMAHAAGVALTWTAPAAIFVAVWMIYAADRLLDARLLDARPLDTHASPTGLEERHRFHHRHRSRFFAAIAVSAFALVLLLPRIPNRSLELYALLATLLGAWLLLIHARPPHVASHRLPKELAVGLFFPAACFIPTVARAPQLQLQLLPAAALLAATCTLNCLFLYAWEHEPGHLNTRGPQAHAHWTTLWSIRHLRHLSLTLLALSLGVASLHRLASRPAWACAISTALLLLLHAQRRRIAPIHLRAAADLALLTPVLLLLL